MDTICPKLPRRYHHHPHLLLYAAGHELLVKPLAFAEDRHGGGVPLDEELSWTILDPIYLFI